MTAGREIKAPVFIGYFPKKTVLRDDWLADKSVVDICSVSECMSSGPEEWLDLWRHNECWVYD